MGRVRGSAVAVGLLAVALSGCSGGGSGSSSEISSAAHSAAASSPKTSVAAASGSVDCAGLTKEDLAAYLVDTQLMAQVRDQASVQALRDHSLGDYTPEKFAAILAKLQVLRGHPAAGFGDPAGSLDYYKQANDLLGQILATTGDVPQGLLDEYRSAVGDTSAVIAKQLPINAALSEYCPKAS